MAQCREDPRWKCTGTVGSCARLNECAISKTDREDAERDSRSERSTSNGGMGFWGWFFVILIAIYFLVK